MKKFIATIPPYGGQSEVNYTTVNNEKLKNKMKTCFPVLPLIKGYCNPDEKIEIVIVYVDDEANKAGKENFEKFKEQAALHLDGINYKINDIAIKYDESVEAHLNTFTKIIEQIKEGDELYTDITFGKKPVPIIQIMALNYALRVMKDVRVECLIYGDRIFGTENALIYDVTSLLYMDEFVNGLSKTNTKDPIEVIKELIK